MSDLTDSTYASGSDLYDPLEDACASCPDPKALGATGSPLNECPNSRRPCGHHCNCSWVHDVCDWCGVTFGEDGKMSYPEGDNVSRITAPFTDAQVAGFNGWQRAGWVHPFTCANRGDGKHRVTSDLGVLMATPSGWTCPDCDYTQAWAHSFMANGPPPDPFASDEKGATDG